MDLPVGRSESPEYFQSRARLFAELHCASRPVLHLIGNIPSAPHMFVGDDMVIEVDSPERSEQSAHAWGRSYETVLGLEPPSETKKKLTGNWPPGAILSGLRVSVESVEFVFQIHTLKGESYDSQALFRRAKYRGDPQDASITPWHFRALCELYRCMGNDAEAWRSVTGLPR